MNEPVARRRRTRRFPRPGEHDEAPQPARTSEDNVLAAAHEEADPIKVERPDMRPDMREETSIEAAERRTREILEGGELLDHTAKYELPEGIEPDGWVYQWKATSIAGKPNTQHIQNLQHNGWEFVPAANHPELVGASPGVKVIERDGQTLMMRPRQIEDMILERDRNRARAQVRQKEAQLKQAPPGTFERGTHPNAPVKIGKSYERIVLPKD